jgi:chromosome segregation protein
LGPETDPKAAEAKARFDAALAALREARAALETAETDRAAAAAAEISARDAARKAEDQLGRLKTEARGLAQLTALPAKTAFAPALDQIIASQGYEAALAAALGDDLNAALNAQAPSYWGGRDAESPVWPAGVAPLAPLIRAPEALAARLAFTGLVDRQDGARLQADLPAGARLVSREGDLWRWDGFVARAEAPRPAAVRLEQRRRLAELEAEIETVTPAAAAATAAQSHAVKALQAADEVLRAARRGPEKARAARPKPNR